MMVTERGGFFQGYGQINNNIILVHAIKDGFFESEFIKVDQLHFLCRSIGRVSNASQHTFLSLTSFKGRRFLAI